jgi:hypothetical protein
MDPIQQLKKCKPHQSGTSGKLKQMLKVFEGFQIVLNPGLGGYLAAPEESDSSRCYSI